MWTVSSLEELIWFILQEENSILASCAFQLLVLILLFTPRYPPYCAHVHITPPCCPVSPLLPPSEFWKYMFVYVCAPEWESDECVIERKKKHYMVHEGSFFMQWWCHMMIVGSEDVIRIRLVNGSATVPALYRFSLWLLGVHAQFYQINLWNMLLSYRQCLKLTSWLMVHGEL